MPKKIKQVVKKKKSNSKSTFAHQSFKLSPHHTDSFINKYFVAGLAIVLVVFAVLLIKSLAVPTDINVVTTGTKESGKSAVNPCGPSQFLVGGRCTNTFKGTRQKPK